MAGGVARFSGGVLIIAGVVVLVAGVVALLYGLAEEDQNQEQGLFASDDESEMNQGLVIGGGVGMLLGLIVAVVGIAFVVGGQARRDKVQQQSDVHVGGSAEPLVAQQAQGAQAGAGGAKPAVMILAFAVAMLVVVVVVAYTDDGSSGLFGDAPPIQLGSESAHGTFRGYPGFPVMADDRGDMTLPSGTQFVAGELVWDAATYGGASELRLIIETNDSGTWRVVTEAAGTSPVLIGWDVPLLSLGDIRFRVEPVDSAPVFEQEFDVRFEYWTP